MREITFQAKMNVLELYVKGFSTNDIVGKTGISKGAVVSIIKDAREGKSPNLQLKGRIDELHDFSVRLRKEGIDLPQARLGSTLLDRLWELGVEPDTLKGWIEFCSQISPDPPEGFIPAAIEFYRIEKETGMVYSDIASRVQDLSTERERLIQEVDDLQAKERRASQLKQKMEDDTERVEKLTAKKGQLEKEVGSLRGFLQRKAEQLGIPIPEFEAMLSEASCLEEDIAQKLKEKKRLEAEVEALIKREQKLSSRIEKAGADFKEDIRLIRDTRKELLEIGVMKGRYEKEIEDMEWGMMIIPFLANPGQVADDDFSLISVVVNCVDKWIQAQPQWRLRWFSLNWDEVRRHVQSRRTQLGKPS